MQTFAEWLQAQIDAREWTKAEFARRSGIDPGTVSNVLNDMRKPGPEFCRDAAAAFGLPEAVVFYRAGLLTQDPEDPTEALDPVALDILAMLSDRSEAEQQAALAALKALFDGIDRGKSGSTGTDREAASRPSAG